MSSLALNRKQDQVPAVDLVANGKILSTAANRLGGLVPTDPSIGVEAIRRLYHENGYVWLKRFLDPEAVNAFRGWVFAHLARGGLA